MNHHLNHMGRYLSVMVIFLGVNLIGGEPVPYYSQKDYYVLAPPAKGLPSGPNEMRQKYPGFYEDVGGIVFHSGFHYPFAPDQPFAAMPAPTWASPTDQSKPLKIVALYKPVAFNADMFDLVQRLGGQVKGVPLPFTKKPKPPRGVRFSAMALKRLREVLSGPVDLILVNKQLATIPEESQKEFQGLILNKVKSGTGLLVVGPIHGIKGPLLDALPVAYPDRNYDKVFHDFRKIKPGNSWLTGGVAFELWPGRDIKGLQPWVDFDPRMNTMIHYEAKPGTGKHGSMDNLPLMFTGKIGKGTVVVMGYAGWYYQASYLPFFDWMGGINQFFRANEFYEQMFSLLAKAARFAVTGKMPPVQVEWPKDQKLAVAAGQTTVKLKFKNQSNQSVEIKIQGVLRDGPTWEKLSEKTLTVTAKGNGETSVDLPIGPIPEVSGILGPASPLLNISVRNEKGEPMDWGTILLQPADQQLLSCQQAKVTVYRGEKDKIQLDAKQPVEWRCVDQWGRIYAEGKTGAGKHEVEIVPDFLSGLTTFIADSRNNQGQLTARAVREIWTPMYPYPREYYNLLWPAHAQGYRLRKFTGNVLRRQGGINVILGGGYYGNTVRNQNLIRSGQRIAMTNAGPRAPYRELPKFPEEIEKKHAQARKFYPGNIGRYGPLTIHLQDERHSPNLSGMGHPKLGEKALALFKQWLKKEYGSISKLNEQWGTSYQDFDQVKPVSDPLEVIKNPGSWAAWLDMCNFVEREVAMAYDVKMAKLLNEETRGHVTTGFEGIFGLYESHLNPYGGLNVPLLFDSGVKMNNMAYGIGSPMWELCASLNPEAEAGTWLGYESEETSYQTEPWRGVLSGATFIGWFIDTLWFTAQGAVDPRLSWIESYTRPLRQGVGRMLNESKRQFQDVAILANMRSHKMAWMQGWKMDPKGKARGNHWMLRPMSQSGNAMLTMCRDFGISPAYITEGQIVKGRLKDFKVLVLVYDLSMDSKVAEAIREWVKAGGVVIADCGAGVANKHGNFPEKGQLDDVFGIKREGEFTTIAEAGDFTVGLLTPAQELVDLNCGQGNWYMVEYFEPNLKATTAKACGVYVFGDKAQMCFWNKFGKGRSLYFGFLLNRYRSEEKDRLSVYPLFTAALRYGGVKPLVALTDLKENPVKGYTVNNFIDRRNIYTGIMKRRKEMPDEVMINYDNGTGYCYEVMTNSFLGNGNKIKIDLAGNEPAKAGMPIVLGQVLQTSQEEISGMALIARLPYKVAGVSMIAKPAKPGGKIAVEVTVKAEKGKADRHVLYLDVRDPDGNQAEPYCRNVVTTDGIWRGTIPLALNDRTGQWELTVREAITGKTAKTKVKVQ